MSAFVYRQPAISSGIADAPMRAVFMPAGRREQRIGELERDRPADGAPACLTLSPSHLAKWVGVSREALIVMVDRLESRG